MRYISRGSAMVTALLVLGVSVASGQHPQTRKGFWIGFGVGWGSYGISCSGCSGLGREGSYTGYLKMGGTVSPHLLLGGESIAWSKTESGSTITAGNLTLSGYYYPQPASGLFLSSGSRGKYHQHHQCHTEPHQILPGLTDMHTVGQRLTSAGRTRTQLRFDLVVRLRHTRTLALVELHQQA